MYSEHEIDAVDGYEKMYRSFWNSKAQEILSNPDTSKVLLGDVMAVRGAIDTAWAMKKAELLKLDATKLLKIAEDNQDHLPKKKLVQMKTVREDIEKVNNELITLNSVYTQVEELHQCKPYPDPAKKMQLEGALNYHMSLLKKANEALRKAVIRRQADLSSVCCPKVTKENQVPELDYSEVEEVVKTVKHEDVIDELQHENE